MTGYCTSCGAPLPDKGNYCLKCGSMVDAPNGAFGAAGMVGGGSDGFNTLTQPPTPPGSGNGGNGGNSNNGGKKRTALIVLICCISAVVVAALILAGFLFFNNGSDSGTVVVTSSSSAVSASVDSVQDSSAASSDSGSSSTSSDAGTTESGATGDDHNGAAGSQATSATVPDTSANQGSGNNAGSSDEDIYTTLYVVNCNESISLRESPSTSAPSLMQIPLGAAVSYISTASDGFYYISYLGTNGYALASYLSPDDTSGTSTHAQNIYKVVNCNEWITLRTSPSTSASEIVKIPLGATVRFLDSAPDGFYKVEYDGHVGYALASYLERQ